MCVFCLLLFCLFFPLVFLCFLCVLSLEGGLLLCFFGMTGGGQRLSLGVWKDI